MFLASVVHKLLGRAKQTPADLGVVPTGFGVVGGRLAFGFCLSLAGHQLVCTAARQFVFQKEVRHILMPARNDERVIKAPTLRSVGHRLSEVWLAVLLRMLAADAGFAKHRGAIARVLQEVRHGLLSFAKLRGHIESQVPPGSRPRQAKLPVWIE